MSRELSLRGRTALVIAGGSFVGRHLCHALRAHGCQVVSTGRGEPRGYCDIGERESVLKLFQEMPVDYVFQCAGATTSDAMPEALYRVHVTGALNVLQAARELQPETVLVFLGSAAEYGSVAAASLPINEEQAERPISLFGASKAAQTQLVLNAARAWNLRAAVVRPFNLLGPGLPDHYLATALVKRLLHEGTQPLTLANAEATRDFVDVRDTAEALALLVERAVPEPGQPELYNLASGTETPIHALAQRLCDLHGGGRTLTRLGMATSRSGIGRSRGDATRLRQATGWQPRFDWRQSVEVLWNQAASAACSEHAA